MRDKTCKGQCVLGVHAFQSIEARPMFPKVPNITSPDLAVSLVSA